MHKVVGLLLGYLLLVSGGFSQIIWLKDSLITHYICPQQSDSVMILPFSYGQYQIHEPSFWKKNYPNKVIQKVEIVYSAFPLDTATWNHGGFRQLQNRRLQALFSLDTVFLKQSIYYQNVIQTDCIDKQAAKQLFHGFVVHLQVSHSAQNSNTAEDSMQNKIRQLVDFKIGIIKKFVDGQVAFKDSVIFKVFSKYPEWDKMLVVIDLTGSMYPYTAQLLRWIRTHADAQRIAHLFFFNDGDDYIKNGGTKLDIKNFTNKVIGKTGGIYAVPPNDIEEVLDTLQAAMLGGEGGDTPENDVEALLYALNNYQAPYKEIVLIGDNLSAIRDLELSSKITKPVHILLCDERRNYNPHPDKVILAYKTKGSIHGIADDVDFTDEKTAFIWQNKAYSIENRKVIFLKNIDNK
ncbi:MAG: hypothetical protein LC115_03560 [Bacteroidia bacterium]|nr:hypothetical protein [Bacteroidia bacterium]